MQDKVRDRWITLRVTPDEFREIHLVAKAEGRSTSEAIRLAMRRRANSLTRSDAR